MREHTWEQIHEAHDKGQWAALLELCAIHLKQTPDHLEARIPQAIALKHLNRLEESAKLLQQTYDAPNASSKCKYQCQRELGQTFEEMGRFDDARRAYDVGDFAAAREWLSRALACPEGDFDEAHFNIGSTYLCEQNYPKAIEHYQKAITLDPKYDIAWERLADAKRAVEIREQSK